MCVLHTARISSTERLLWGDEERMMGNFKDGNEIRKV